MFSVIEVSTESAMIELKNIRKAINLSQETLSLRSGVDRGYISKIENGKASPTISILGKLAEGMEKKLKVSFERR